MAVVTSSIVSFADEVITADRAGRETMRKGTITDLKGTQLTLTTSSGRETKIPLERVQSYEADRSAVHQQADQQYAQRNFAAALPLYRDALRDEPRRWVKRKLLAQLIWCQRNMDMWGAACKNFERLIAEDPETPYFATIPLQWQMQPCPRDVAEVIRRWSGTRNDDALRLIAASWLLTSDRSTYATQLRDLARTSSTRVKPLAITQLQREKMLTLREAEISLIMQAVESTPRELRAGGYYLLGEAFARFDRADESALAYLRVPSEYDDDLLLSQKALIGSASQLAGAGHAQEAIKLYRQTIELSAKTESGQRAMANLNELTK